MKPRANIKLFGILIGIVDAHKTRLEKQVRQGHIAAREIEGINHQIDDLEDYNIINRHDRREVEDNNRYIESLNQDINDREVIARRGESAAAQLPEIYAFEKKWKPILNMAEIEQIKAQYKVCEDRLAKLDDRIDACEINMDPSVRTPDVVAQAARDLEHYKSEYDSISAQRNRLIAQIHAMGGKVR